MCSFIFHDRMLIFPKTLTVYYELKDDDGYITSIKQDAARRAREFFGSNVTRSSFLHRCKLNSDVTCMAVVITV